MTFMSRKHALKHISALFKEMRARMHEDTDLADSYVKHIRKNCYESENSS